jgi:hypothetical protein
MRRLPASLVRGAYQPARTQEADVAPVPAPIGGWNARDPIAAMAPTDAVTLDNWWVRVADCVIRGGESDWLTGLALAPKALPLYTPPTGANKQFVTTDSGFYDATTAGAVGAVLKALTTGYVNWFQMGVSGGHYLCTFNGIDKPVFYDGTNFISIDGVSTPAITGVTTTNLITGTVYARRMFLVEKNKNSFWYLPADSIGGTANEFLLGPLCKRGGFCMAVANWTYDGGAGSGDYFVAVTSEGEVLVFTGTDPSTAANWNYVGTYYMAAKPIGRKCFKSYGGDLVLVTEFGTLPLSKMLQAASIDFKTALTNKIEGVFTDTARSYGVNQGWEVEIYPAQYAMIVNIPTGTGAIQYVMNTITKQWCSFSGWNAAAFSVFNKELYFADSVNKRVAKAWSGKSDHGTNIVAQGQTAYNYFGKTKTQAKEFSLYRPQLLTDGPISFTFGLSVDFRTNVSLATATYSSIAGALWDVSLWDQGFWAGSLEIQKDWLTPACYTGYCASAILKIATNAVEIHWMSNDYVYKDGGVIG